MNSMRKIGYVPYSKDMNHPGDRRRIASWNRSPNYILETENPLDSEILLLSNGANFGKWIRCASQPVVIDLVDGYLGENPNFLQDFLRNLVRSLAGTSSLKWITYTRHLKWACENSYCIVVASEEQRDLVLPFNPRVHVILDNHSELLPTSQISTNIEVYSIVPKQKYIFWEGFGYTLKHFRHISKELDTTLKQNGWKMYLLTVETFPRWGGYIGKVSTRKLVKKLFPLSNDSIEIIPWSISNLMTYSHRSAFSIIPLDPVDKFGMLKSENKLLSNWVLGIRTLFSASPAYSRVARKAEVTQDCVFVNEWAEKLQLLIDKNNFELQDSVSKYLEINHTMEVLNANWTSVFKEVSESHYGKV